MDYKELYRSKLTDVEGALSMIRDGDVVIGGAVGQEPQACLNNLHTLAGKVHGVKYMSGLGMRSYPFMTDPACRDTFSYDCIFLMGPGREAHRQGLVDVIPAHLHNGFDRWSEANGKPNVFMTAVSPMDKHGYFRVPLCVIQERAILERADIVIVEVNPNLPATLGDTQLHVRDVDAIIETDYDIATLEPGAIDEDDRTIGAYIAEQVHDGDTIQLGIGGIPDAAAQALMSKHDLGIHTEMIGNSMADLIEAGVVTGKRKGINREKVIGAFAMGNRRLYDLLDNNPGIELRRGEYVNDPQVISQHDNFVSINTALTIDLGGQVCSESIGSLQYSGSGGQVDTAVGALHAKGGRNIIAVKSIKNTKQGVVSSINAQLPLGSVVTLSRNDLDCVVTEYGTAYMRGRTVRQRVDNLIAVAHPDFRAQLRKDAERLLLW